MTAARQTAPPGPDLATGLVRLARLVDHVFAQACAAHGLTVAQARLLCILAERPRGMAELAGLLGIDKAGITGLTDRVERRGLAERTAVPQDRRALQVRLTEQGQRDAVAVHDDVCVRLDVLTAALAPADRERFRQVIAVVTRVSEAFPPPSAAIRDAVCGRSPGALAG